MLMWLILQFVTIASMLAAYRMALARGRSTTAWLVVALVFGPLALPALLVLGRRNNEATPTLA